MIEFLKRIRLCTGWPVLVILMMLLWTSTGITATILLLLALPRWVITGKGDLMVLLKELEVTEKLFEDELAYIFIGEKKPNREETLGSD